MVIQSIQNNVSALQIILQLNNTQDALSTNLKRLSTGLRINNPSDDPGGFVLSNRLQTQFRGLGVASENTQTSLNLVNTGSNAVSQIVNILNDIRDSAVAASGGSATEQAVILERLDELNRIANTTKFDGKYLLNGALTNEVGFVQGTRSFGASLSFGPNATDLLQGRSFLNITESNSGTVQLATGGDATFNAGINTSVDNAVTTAQFINAGVAAVGGDNLTALTANRVTLQNNGSIQFNGTLANGTTAFSGALSIGAGTTFTDLVTSIQNSIDAAESSIDVNGTGTLETTVAIDGNGRLTFNSSGQQEISQFDIDFTIENAATATQTRFGVERDATIYNPQVGTTASGGLIGNSVTSITGSTFDTGTFNITVSNVLNAQQRQITTQGFDRNFPGTQPALPTTNLNASFFNGVSIFDNDIFVITGTEPDGTTFGTSYTVGTDTGVGDGIIEDYASLIAELNNRDKTLTSVGFNGAVATLTGNGEIRLVDDVAQTSLTDLSIEVQDVSAGTSQFNNATVDQGGRRESATISIDGGPAQDVVAGQVVTLQGVNPSGGNAPEVTFRVGRGFTAGTDELQTTAREFIGTLNGGPEMTFQNGDTGVKFTAGEFSVYPIEKFQQVTLDFDAILDITASSDVGGETFVLSATSNSFSFQIGSDSDEIKQFLFADLRSNNLGTGPGATLDDIDVTTGAGATAALDIIDDALDQANEFAGRLGAFQARLDDTIDTLSLGALSLETAYTDIVSADIAKETTELATNSIILQSQAAVLTQSNGLSNDVFKILFGLT